MIKKYFEGELYMTKKHFAPFFGAFMAAALLSMLLFSSCIDSLNQPEPAASELGTVRLSLLNRKNMTEQNARTLVPGGNAWLSYKIEASQEGAEPQLIDGDWDGSGSKTFDMEPGDWTITVTGFITEGEHKTAVSRGAENVTITANQSTESVSIQMEWIAAAEGTGYFSYTFGTGTEGIRYPIGVTLSHAALTLESLAEGADPIEKDLLEDGTDIISLGAGYYVLTVTLINGDGNGAAKSEIVHLYKDLTTAADNEVFTFVEADFIEPSYSIIIANNITNGSINASPASGIAGTTVTLSNTPDTDYALSYYTVDGETIEGNSFTLNGNVTVSAVFERSYSVTIDPDITNGSISPSPTSGIVGTIVTLSNTPDAGYVLNYYTVDGEAIEGNSFTLTDDVTVSAVFERSYSVTIATDITNGSINASLTSGIAGTTITLSNTPDSGYIFDYYTVDGERITGNSFTLIGDVTVSAEFIQSNGTIPIGSPSVILYLNDGATPLAEGGRIDVGSAGLETYTVSIADGSYSQIIWYLNGRAVPGETETSIVLSKQVPGVYLVTVEATLEGGDKNTGSHTFVVQQQ